MQRTGSGVAEHEVLAESGMSVVNAVVQCDFEGKLFVAQAYGQRLAARDGGLTRSHHSNALPAPLHWRPLHWNENSSAGPVCVVARGMKLTLMERSESCCVNSPASCAPLPARKAMTRFTRSLPIVQACSFGPAASSR